MARVRLFLAPIFPHGIGFKVGDRSLHYAPIAGSLEEGRRARPHFILEVSALPLKEALEYGRFSDLGIGMFVTLHLERTHDPRWVYLFFSLLAMHDYGHLDGPRAFFRWAGFLLRMMAPRRLAKAASS